MKMMRKSFDLRDMTSLIDSHSDLESVVIGPIKWEAASVVEAARPLFGLVYARAEECKSIGGRGGRRHAQWKKLKDKPTTSSVKITSDDAKWPEDIPHEGLDIEVDWRKKKGVLRETMKQGELHVCWAISITRCMESMLVIEKRAQERVNLSVQHLVNHIRKKKRNGMVTAFEEIRSFLKQQGVVLEDICAFERKIKDPCFHPDAESFKLKDLIVSERVDEKELIKLVTKGPRVVILDLCPEFVKYEKVEKHAVLVTGYGTTPDGIHYWIIQNSYGVDWGEEGFAKIIRQCSRKNKEPSLFLGVLYPEFEAIE